MEYFNFYYSPAKGAEGAKAAGTERRLTEF